MDAATHNVSIEIVACPTDPNDRPQAELEASD